MRTWMIFQFIFVMSTFAHANSYVGNGGNQGDVELMVTFMQIRESFDVISTQTNQDINLCACNNTFEGRSVCEPLTALTEVQAKFCQKSLIQIAPQIVKMIDHRDEINIRWTNTSIEVEENGQKRAADAVANSTTHELVINQPKFFAMKQPDRVLLLTHELAHFAELDGARLTDTGSIGPFNGDQGSRHLVNAMAAAASVLPGVFPEDIDSYQSKLSRSQAWRKNWFGFDGGNSNVLNGSDSNFASNSFRREQLSYRYQLAHWGVMAIFQSESTDTTIMDSISVKEDLSIFGVGPTYRIFLTSDPLTFWGQSHFLVHALAENVQAKYKLSDNYTGTSDSASVFGANFGAAYYIPFFWGFWIQGGVDYEIHPYKYSNPLVNLDYKHNLVSSYLGVSYAF